MHKSKFKSLFLWLPFLLYFCHASLFSNWLVDDAGISFAYARNWAQGFGLVAQPQIPPVEGYSNFLWVALMALFFKGGFFSLYATPKLLSISFVLGVFFMIKRLAFEVFKFSTTKVLLCLSLLSINSPFVMWSVGGLENPLYCFLIICFAYLLISQKTPDETKLKALFLGFLAGLIGLTRPDGIAFGVAGLLCLIISKQKKVKILQYVACLSLVLGTYQVFRIDYFAQELPLPFYAKGGIDFADIFSLKKLYDLNRSIGGPFGIFIFFAGLLLQIRQIVHSGIRESQLKWTLIMFSSIGVFLLLPYDWLDWYRYASPYYPLFYVWLLSLEWESLMAYLPSLNAHKTMVTISICLIIASGLMGGIITDKRIREPIVPLAFVAERYGHTFNQYLEVLELQDASIMLPDLGGTLLYSKLRVFDMAGLCDKTIAETFVVNHPAFLDYVFEEVKPSFIHTHGLWTLEANFDSDPRFRYYYEPINEYIEQYIYSEYKIKIYAGDYVRSDLVSSRCQSLEYIIQNIQNTKMTRP